MSSSIGLCRSCLEEDHVRRLRLGVGVYWKRGVSWWEILGYILEDASGPGG